MIRCLNQLSTCPVGFFISLSLLGHSERVPTTSPRHRLRLPRWAAVHLPAVLRVVRAHGSVRPDKRGRRRAHEALGRLQQGGAGGRGDGRGN